MSADFRPFAATRLHDPAADSRRGPVPENSGGYRSAEAGAPAGSAEHFAPTSGALALDADSLPEAHRFRAAPEAEVGEARVVAFQSIQKPTEKEHAARAAGYASGYAAGWAAATREEAEAVARRIEERTEAETEAVARLTQMRSALVMALETARSVASPVLQMHADEITMAAISLAEELVGGVLCDERRRIVAALERALAIEEDAGAVRVRMHPTDITRLREFAADPEIAARLPEDVDLVADPSLEPGDAVTELEVGYVDARLSSALARVRAEMRHAEDESAELPER